VKFPEPVFIGDTIHVLTEVLSRRLSQSRPGTGIVTFRHTGMNQRDEVVCLCVRQGMMMTRPQKTAA
jgi:acyl dehydratase